MLNSSDPQNKMCKGSVVLVDSSRRQYRTLRTTPYLLPTRTETVDDDFEKSVRIAYLDMNDFWGSIPRHMNV